MAFHAGLAGGPQVAMALGASVHPFTKITPRVNRVVTRSAGFSRSSPRKPVNDRSIPFIPFLFYPGKRQGRPPASRDAGSFPATAQSTIWFLHFYLTAGGLDLKLLAVGRDPVDKLPDIPVEGIVILPGKDELKASSTSSRGAEPWIRQQFSEICRISSGRSSSSFLLYRSPTSSSTRS